MPFQKGDKNINRTGRKPGKANKLTSELRTILKDFISDEITKLPATLKKLTDIERVQLLVKLLPYVLPKLQDDKQADFAYLEHDYMQRDEIGKTRTQYSFDRWQKDDLIEHDYEHDFDISKDEITEITIEPPGPEHELSGIAPVNVESSLFNEKQMNALKIIERCFGGYDFKQFDYTMNDILSAIHLVETEINSHITDELDMSEIYREYKNYILMKHTD